MEGVGVCGEGGGSGGEGVGGVGGREGGMDEERVWVCFFFVLVG